MPLQIKSEATPSRQQQLELMKDTCKCIAKSHTQSVYKLPLSQVLQNHENRIAQCVVVDPCLFVVLLVGATGAGKTTLINAIVNSIFGVSWSDDFRLKLVTQSDEGFKSQAESQTQCVTAYTLHRQESSTFPHTLTIIDTPGFGDTKGLENDKLITAKLRNLLSVQDDCGIQQIHAIGLVIPASEGRFTVSQQYMFSAIQRMFGRNVRNNLFLMITFADGKKPPVLETVKAAGIHFHKYFKFNNSVLYWEESMEQHKCSDEQSELFWKNGASLCTEFLQELQTVKAVSLQQTRDVLKGQEQLKDILQQQNRDISELVEKMSKWEEAEKMIEQCEADIVANREYTVTLDHTAQDVVNIGGLGIYVTNCTNCNMTCCDNCRYSNDSDLRSCRVMSSGYCTVCPGK